DTIEHLYDFRPDFISCTYGAGGTNKGRNTEIVGAIQKAGRAAALTHFTCIGNTREDITRSMEEYTDLDVSNILAMRGDLPTDWTGTGGDFAHADALIAFIKKNHPNFCLAAACYPEKHIQAATFDEDIAHLRAKQDNGAEYLMTQLCHDVDAYTRFVERIRKAGIKLPIVVGLMPVLSKDPIIRMTVSNGCSIPKELAAIIGKYGSNPDDFKKAGKEYTVAQIYRFMDAGINGLHIYSLNKYQDVSDILHMSGIRV
ncbi:MAG: methylenetetrahydrofolate reductase, partial [Clostridia bacterium]